MQFSFITETATNRSLPQEAEFWDQLFGEAVSWGLEVYEQDWQDRWELRRSASKSSIRRFVIN